MTVTGIEIENVQPFEHAIIEPSKKVTVIKGTSHGGKSSFIRAVKKAIENRPMGREGLFSWFANDKDYMRIGMSFEEGTYVYREQSDSDNKYTTSESKKPYRALRGDVPEEVSAVTQMNSVNIQSQLDPYFMLQSTPGEVGRMFNEAVKLEIIDETISQAKKVFNTINSQRVACYNQVELLEKDLIKYELLDELKELVDKVNERYKALSFLHENRPKLRGYIEEIGTLEGDILITKEFLKLEKLHMELSVEAAYLKQMKTKRKQLHTDILEYAATDARIAVNKKWAKMYELFIEIRKIAENVSKLKSERIQLRRALRLINDTKDAIQAKTNVLSSTRKQIRELLQKTKLCPFCYSEIDQEIIDHICERKGI